MRFVWSALLAALLSEQSFGQEVTLQLKGDTTIVQVDKVVVTKEDRLVVKSFPFQVVAPADIGFYYWTYPAGVKASDKGNILEVSLAPKGDTKFDLKVQSGIIENGKIKYITQFSSIVVAVGAPDPGPIPPPDPKPIPPPDPKPAPVTSFRVIFVWESGKTLPQGQIAVMDAKVTRDYLAANTTPEGSWTGYRKYDKDQDGSKDFPNMAALWAAVRPKVTTVPCVAIERNGQVDIVPLAATPEAMIDVFKKYKGGA